MALAKFKLIFSCVANQEKNNEKLREEKSGKWSDSTTSLEMRKRWF